MEYLRIYSEEYPEDNLVVTGGTAAYLHLKECGIETYINDIDVNLTTSIPNKNLIRRFENILPDTYVAYPEYFWSDRLLHVRFVDTLDQDFELDIMVNDMPIFSVVNIDGLNVISLNSLIKQYSQELPGRKMDVDYFKKHGVPAGWQGDDVEVIIDKYYRIKERLVLLLKCQKSKRDK